jgi:hypothetical protein
MDHHTLSKCQVTIFSFAGILGRFAIFACFKIVTDLALPVSLISDLSDKILLFCKTKKINIF